MTHRVKIRKIWAKRLIILLGGIGIISFVILFAISIVFGKRIFEPAGFTPILYEFSDSTCQATTIYSQANLIHLSMDYDIRYNGCFSLFERYVVNEEFIYKKIKSIEVMVLDTRTDDTLVVTERLRNGVSAHLMRDYIKREIILPGSCSTGTCDSVNEELSRINSGSFDKIRNIVERDSGKSFNKEYVLAQLNWLDSIRLTSQLYCKGIFNTDQIAGDLTFFIREYNDGIINTGKIVLYEGPVFKLEHMKIRKGIQPLKVIAKVNWINERLNY